MSGKGKKRPTYGSKRRIRSDGYLDIFEPRHPLARTEGYVAAHRKIAWDAGVLTDPTLQIHHRNEDKTDNRFENLQVLSVAEHTALHHPRQPTSFRARWERLRAIAAETCEACGADIVGRRSDAIYCSDRCRVNAWKRANR